MGVSHLKIPKIETHYRVVWSKEIASVIDVKKLPVPSRQAVHTLWDEMDPIAIGCHLIELTYPDNTFSNGSLKKLYLPPSSVRYWLDVHVLIGYPPYTSLASYKQAAQWLWNELLYKNEAPCHLY
jgi:hypothetical protein